MGLLKKILGAPNAAMRALAEHAVVNRLKSWAEAPADSFQRRAYEAAKGKKTATGLALGIASFWAVVFEQPTLAMWLGSASAVLIGAGLADKALSADGRPAALESSQLYKFLSEHAGWITSGLTIWGTYVMSTGCTAYVVAGLTFTCATQGKIILAIAAAGAYFKVLDVAAVTSIPGLGRFKLPKH